MIDMTLAVRPVTLRGAAAKLGGVSSGHVVGYEPRALTFEITWGTVTIEHRLPIPEQGGIRAYHTDPEGPSTGSLAWTLSDRDAVIAEGSASTYVDRGRDCCIIDFGEAVASLVSIVVYADHDDLAEIVRELELVSCADLIGRDDIPLPN